jgi:hypothetical protein
MGQPRRCLVSFRDHYGVEHVAEVTAESLYEAGALALQLFRRAEWSREASLDAGTLRVEVCESSFYRVKVTELEAWLKRTGGAPREVFMRRTIHDRLAKSGNP